MTKFQIEWADGSKDVEVSSEHKTVEDFVACKFGSAYDPKKAKVSIEGEEAQEAPVKKPSKKKADA